MDKTLIYFLISCVGLKIVYTANILCVFPHPDKNRDAVYRTLAIELAWRGNRVTVVTANPIKNANLTDQYIQIDLRDVSMKKWTDLKNISSETAESFHRVFAELNDAQLSSPQMKQLMKTKEKFDVVMVEAFAFSMFHLAEHLGAPAVGISAADVSILHHELMGNPTHPTAHLTPRPSFWSRLAATYNYALYAWFRQRTEIALHDQVAKKHFPLATKSIWSAMQEMGLMFVNTHPVLMDIRPTVPKLKFFGFLHITEKNIPERLHLFLDNSDSGVIVVNLDEKYFELDKTTTTKLVEIFSTLSIDVIWKTKDIKNTEVINDNILYTDRLPQANVLDHPSVRMLICDASHNSLEDAIWSGVPVLGIEVSSDRYSSIAGKIETLGVGAILPKESIRETAFTDTIRKILDNSTFREKARELSEHVRDEVWLSLDRAIWWLEYVIHHQDMKLFDSPVAEMPFYQYYFLDIAFFLAIIAMIIIKLVKMCVTICLKKSRTEITVTDKEKLY